MKDQTTAYSCFNRTTGRLLLHDVDRADRLLSRAVGLLGRPTLAPGQGLWIVPCRQVHTAMMGFPLDVLFLDRNLEVIALRFGLAPWRLSGFYFKAHSVLEALGGSLAGRATQGHCLTFEKNRE